MIKRNNVEVLWANDSNLKMVSRSLQAFSRANEAILKSRAHYKYINKAKKQVQLQDGGKDGEGQVDTSVEINS